MKTCVNFSLHTNKKVQLTLLKILTALLRLMFTSHLLVDWIWDFFKSITWIISATFFSFVFTI